MLVQLYETATKGQIRWNARNILTNIATMTENEPVMKEQQVPEVSGRSRRDPSVCGLVLTLSSSCIALARLQEFFGAANMSLDEEMKAELELMPQ